MFDHLPRRPLRPGAPIVFLVDEDPRRRYATAELLRAEGFNVCSASGHEPLFEVFASCLTVPATWVSLVAAIAPDAVVVDLEGEHAVVTVGALRRHALTAGVPIVAYGGQSREQDAALSMGAEAVVLDPAPEARIGDCVRAALGEEQPAPRARSHFV